MSEHGTYTSYKSLFKIKWKIYSIGEKELPRPIPIDALGVFIVMFIPSYLIITPVVRVFFNDLNKILIAMVINSFVTWIVYKTDPQGRPFLIFLYDIIVFFIKKKRRDYCSVVPSRRKVSIYWETMNFEKEEGDSY